MYKKMYFTLFNAITDATRQLERRKYQAAITTLKEAQIETEDMFVDMCISAEEWEE